MLYAALTSEVTGMDAVIQSISKVTDVIGTVFTAITSNALLVFFLAASVLGVGISMFARLRNVAQ